MDIHIDKQDGQLALSVRVAAGEDADALICAVNQSENWLWEHAASGGWDEQDEPQAQDRPAGTRFSLQVHGRFAVSAALTWARRLPRHAARMLAHERLRAGGQDGAPERAMAPYPVRYFHQGALLADVTALAAALAEPDAAHPLGSFTLSGTALRVTDPCYEKTSRSAGVVQALPGSWLAETVLGDTEWQRRVKVLRIRHQEAPADVFARPDAFTRVTAFMVGVDGGQCGFFDEAFYPEGDPTQERGGTKDTCMADVVIHAPSERAATPAVGQAASGPNWLAPDRVLLDLGGEDEGSMDDGLDEDSGFYAQCCALTQDEQLPGGGVLPAGFGVLSRSGYGDGSYPVKVLKNEAGLVIAALIDFFDLPQDGEADA